MATGPDADCADIDAAGDAVEPGRALADPRGELDGTGGEGEARAQNVRQQEPANGEDVRPARGAGVEQREFAEEEHGEGHERHDGPEDGLAGTDARTRRDRGGCGGSHRYLGGSTH